MEKNVKLLLTIMVVCGTIAFMLLIGMKYTALYKTIETKILQAEGE